MKYYRLPLCTGLLLLVGALASAAEVPDFRPDARAVRRFGAAYRYPQAGWIVLHIEGEPYERGYQHGRLMAEEIAATLRCHAALQSPKAPAEGWKLARTLINTLFVRRYDRELLEEMKGIADGASAAGARFDGRHLDLVDIVGINSLPEIETLPSALDATPTGLEGIRFPRPTLETPKTPKPMHCSAFAATGPATADGKIVFGHVTMFNLYPSLFFNVWLDVKPSKGHRVLMQSYPGGVQSGLDYYLNDAGLIVCETTIAQTRLNQTGLSVACRIRQALQYAESIDRAVEILGKENNGLYTNEWLLGDIKTNEVAMFELGTTKTRLYRSSKNDWFGGTPGIYWGCNNAKDLSVRLETIPGTDARPANLVWKPSDRDKAWQRLIREHHGKINADFGKLAFTTAPLAAYPTLDAKVTTTDMARELKTLALFGPPLGRAWQPTVEEQKLYSEIRPMIGHPWTVLHAGAPAAGKVAGPSVVDLPDKIKSAQDSTDDDGEGKAQLSSLNEDEKYAAPVVAWHGTLLPKSDADIWLAGAFAEYERFVALERSIKERRPEGKLTAEDHDRLAVELYGYRSAYLAASRASADRPLAKVRSETQNDEWYRLAVGKGVLVLHELRRRLGDKEFGDAMEAFGKKYGGQEVSTADFVTAIYALVEKRSKESERLQGFFSNWLTRPGLPVWKMGDVDVQAPAQETGPFKVVIKFEDGGTVSGANVEVDVSTKAAQKESPRSVVAKAQVSDGSLVVETKDRPVRIVLDPHSEVAKANGGVYSIVSFMAELEKTLIVEGTLDEKAANHDAAEQLQRAIRERWSNITVPIKTDQAVTDDDLKTHHLLLIGRPGCNRIVAQMQERLPVSFGSQSFMVRDEAYAHPLSAVIAATENPHNPRWSAVVLAGNGAEATYHAPETLLKRGRAAAEVLIVAHGAKPRGVVVPPRELAREIKVDGK
jgi:hypothetical protein